MEKVTFERSIHLHRWFITALQTIKRLQAYFITQILWENQSLELTQISVMSSSYFNSKIKKEQTSMCN